MHLSPELSDSTFRMLQDYVYEHSGIRIGLDQKSHLRRRLAVLLDQFDLSSFEDLYAHAKYHPMGRKSRMAIIEALTTHETYFYREAHQFELCIKELLEANKFKGPQIRVLSAGCSSGEELLSFAIVLHEAGLLDQWRFEFIGVDISQEVVEKARTGLYRESAFRAAPAHWMNTYFSPVDNGMWKVNNSFLNRLEFHQLNLMDSFKFRQFGEFDLIFCRNVMIYFDQHSKASVVQNFYQRLKNNGYLLLGHAENLIQIESPLVVEHFQRDMIYRKLPLEHDRDLH